MVIPGPLWIGHRRAFPSTGAQLSLAGFKLGQMVARILQSAERQWVAEGFPEAARAEAIVAALIPA